MASISIRIDENDKSRFESFCESVGMNITTVFNMFVKNVINNQKLPFEVGIDSFYSEENMKYLKSAINDVKAGKKMHYHDLIEV